MSNIWAKSPELFLYTKGNDVYLWKCNTTTWMPMITSDFDDLGKVKDHLDLIGGRDALFDWERSYYNDLVAYISSRRLLVNNRGLVIAELQIFGQDGKMAENELPFYIRSLDVLSMKPFGLRDRTNPSRTVRYLEREGRTAPVEDSTSTELDDENRAGLLKQVEELIAANKRLENDKEAANKQVTEMKDANKTLKSEKEAAEKQVTEMKDANKTLKSEKEAAEKQVTELKDANKTLAEDVAAQKTAAVKAQQERDEAKRDKEAAEKTAVDLQTLINSKKVGWINDLTDSGWSPAKTLPEYQHRSVAIAGAFTGFRVEVVGEPGTFTLDDSTTNVRASFIYHVKLIDDYGDVVINLQLATKEYMAVKLEDLNPSNEMARFDRWNWQYGVYHGNTYVFKEM